MLRLSRLIAKNSLVDGAGSFASSTVRVRVTVSTTTSSEPFFVKYMTRRPSAIHWMQGVSSLESMVVVLVAKSYSPTPAALLPSDTSVPARRAASGDHEAGLKYLPSIVVPASFVGVAVDASGRR